MESDKDVKHNFNLKGLKINDTFLGCNKCWFRFAPHTGVKTICPKCQNKMSLFTITEKDINEVLEKNGSKMTTTKKNTIKIHNVYNDNTTLYCIVSLYTMLFCSVLFCFDLPFF